mmetsp:Transcript_11108/g.46363  ORF Transcript_11108/g.46363 Transcript_11108/m.46363 type:complete len:251 (+) Transcript_11108:121-873(+)
MAHRFGDHGDGGGHRGRGRERKCGGADATQGAHRGSRQAEETDRAEGRDQAQEEGHRAGHRARGQEGGQGEEEVRQAGTQARRQTAVLTHEYSHKRSLFVKVSTNHTAVGRDSEHRAEGPRPLLVPPRVRIRLRRPRRGERAGDVFPRDLPDAHLRSVIRGALRVVVVVRHEPIHQPAQRPHRALLAQQHDVRAAVPVRPGREVVEVHVRGHGVRREVPLHHPRPRRLRRQPDEDPLLQPSQHRRVQLPR